MITQIHAAVALVADAWVDDVLIDLRDGRVGDIRSGVAPPPQVRTVPCLIPAWADAHAHLTFSADHEALPDPRAFRDAEGSQQSRVHSRAQAAWNAGVGLIRDLGAPPGAMPILAAANAAPRGMEVQFSGPPLTRRGGHLHRHGHEVERVDDIPAILDELKTGGARWAKVMVTGGRMTPGTNPLAVEFEPSWIKAVVNGSHDRGLKVAAHALGSQGVLAAALAGVDTIEHATLIEVGRGGDEHGSWAEIVDPRILEAMIDHRVAVCPTLVESASPHPVPWDIRAGWVSQFADAGVSIITGGDTGIPGVRHGDHANVVSQLCRALGPAPGIEAATVNCARVLESDTCRLQIGGSSRLTVLPKDPRRGPVDLSQAQVVDTANARPRELNP